MLDFGTLVIEQAEKGMIATHNLVLFLFIFGGILLLGGIVVCIISFLNSDNRILTTGLILVLASLLHFGAGLSWQKSLPKNVVVRIQPTVENLDQMVNGKSIVKRGEDYYFIDTLSNSEIQNLQKTNKLKETVNRDFEETAKVFK
ncbi:MULTISPECIES: hypothetical protein [Peptoniphilus]|uniref:Uncharacterized protein n=1 Tax=Peptoniphilus harei TaxID=54005 RepID=A0A943XVF3_9FIRM|nr:hypothetical protein [Peptoniphilus harei]MBS6535847.1 hypothetical protein [Peptoniphilus harei]